MKILIVDDHPLFREGIGLLLQHLDPSVEPFFGNSIAEALCLAPAHGDLNLILLDLDLPGAVRGVGGLDSVREAYPGVPVVILSAADDPELILRCLDRGAMGFLTKSSPTEVFHSALNLVLLGNIYIPPQALAAMKGTHGASAPQPSPLPTLSPRETAVFNALIEGQSNKLIARNLDIAEQTVKFHVSNILKALKVTNRTQAVIVAARLGFKVSLRRSAAEVCSEVASEVGPR